MKYLPPAVLFRCALASVALLCGASWSGAAETELDEGLLFFEEEVRPILARRCYECPVARAVVAADALDPGADH